MRVKSTIVLLASSALALPDPPRRFQVLDEPVRALGKRNNSTKSKAQSTKIFDHCYNNQPSVETVTVTKSVVRSLITETSVSTFTTWETLPEASATTTALPEAVTGPTSGTGSLGLAPLGSNPFGSNPSGSNPYGSNPFGTNPSGSAPEGSAPSGVAPAPTPAATYTCPDAGPNGCMTINIVNSWSSALSLSYGSNIPGPAPIGDPTNAPMGSSTQILYPSGWGGRIAVGPGLDSRVRAPAFESLFTS